jgi:hypothetical protein
VGKMGGVRGGGGGPGGRQREGDPTVTVWGRIFALREMKSTRGWEEIGIPVLRSLREKRG